MLPNSTTKIRISLWVQHSQYNKITIIIRSFSLLYLMMMKGWGFVVWTSYTPFRRFYDDDVGRGKLHFTKFSSPEPFFWYRFVASYDLNVQVIKLLLSGQIASLLVLIVCLGSKVMGCLIFLSSFLMLRADENKMSTEIQPAL